jgi:hypothetical protein
MTKTELMQSARAVIDRRAERSPFQRRMSRSEVYEG